MKEIELQPEQIMVPREYELANEQILKIYFRIFKSGYGKALPPVITARINETQSLVELIENGRHPDKGGGLRGYEEFLKKRHYSFDWERNEVDQEVRSRREDYRKLFAEFKTSPYILLDGNHRTAAAALTHNPVYALEIETDEDISEIRRMIKRGELFEFNSNETSLMTLKESFVLYCLQLAIKDNGNITFPSAALSLLDETATVKERVKKLVVNGELPDYMARRYKSQ